MVTGDFPKEIKETLSDKNLEGLEIATRNLSLTLMTCEMNYEQIESYLDFLKGFFKVNSIFQWDDSLQPLFCNHYRPDHLKE